MKDTSPPVMLNSVGAVRQVQTEVCDSTSGMSAISSLSDLLPQHLQLMFSKACEHHSMEEQEQLKNLLLEFQDTFSRSVDDLGYTSLVEHAIGTGQSAPLKQPPRRPPIALMQDEKDAN